MTRLKPPAPPPPLKRGVKQLDGVATTRRQVHIDEASATTLLKVGGGNLSLGIREAARRVRAAKLDKAFDPKS